MEKNTARGDDLNRKSESSSETAVQARAAKGAASLSELIHPGARVQIVVLALLLVVAYRVPLTDSVLYRWWNDPNWSHGWLIPLFSLYLLGCRRDELRRAKPRTSLVGLAVLVAAMLMYFGSMLDVVLVCVLAFLLAMVIVKKCVVL